MVVNATTCTKRAKSLSRGTRLVEGADPANLGAKCHSSGRESEGGGLFLA